MADGKIPGFSTDYACAVQVILLADYFGLDSLGTGMHPSRIHIYGTDIDIGIFVKPGFGSITVSYSQM